MGTYQFSYKYYLQCLVRDCREPYGGASPEHQMPARMRQQMDGRSIRQVSALAALFVVACGRDRSPSEPTPVAPVQQGISLRGQVNDTAFRPLPGVRIEILDGLRAGTTAVTDVAGNFLMDGTFSAAPLTVSASKDGYLPSTRRVTLNENQPPNSWWLSFVLEAVAPPINLVGQYTLTLTADTTCTPPLWESVLGWRLPIDAETRTYTATIAPTTRSMFLGTLTGATFVGRSNGFSVGVAGNFAKFNFDDFDDASLADD
jgi:hypothetical protein